jgi:hypothetical protein
MEEKENCRCTGDKYVGGKDWLRQAAGYAIAPTADSSENRRLKMLLKAFQFIRLLQWNWKAVEASEISHQRLDHDT